MKLIYTGTGPAHSCGVSGMGGVYGMMVNGEGVMMTLQTFCKGVYQQSYCNYMYMQISYITTECYMYVVGYHCCGDNVTVHTNSDQQFNTSPADIHVQYID